MARPFLSDAAPSRLGGWEPNGAATGVGSLPHRSVSTALSALGYTPELPYVPHLPHAATADGMLAQLGTDAAPAVVWSDLPTYLATHPSPSGWIKSQAVGPLTLAFTGGGDPTDPVVLSGAMDRCRRWAEAEARRLEPTGLRGMLWWDEPCLGLPELHDALADPAVGSAYDAFLVTTRALGWAAVGLHVCSEAPWRWTVERSPDVLSVDAWRYAIDTVEAALSARVFLASGGIFAWGLVPTTDRLPALDDLTARFDELAFCLDLSPAELRRRSILTPSCGLATLYPIDAVARLATLTDLTAALRRG